MRDSKYETPYAVREAITDEIEELDGIEPKEPGKSQRKASD